MCLSSSFSTRNGYETIKIPLTNFKYIKILKLCAVLFMLLALSLVPVPLIWKFLPLNSFNPTLKNSADAHGDYISFGQWNVTMSMGFTRILNGRITDKISLIILQIVTLKILLTVCYIAECYMISHLPGWTVRATLQSREDLWCSMKR